MRDQFGRFVKGGVSIFKGKTHSVSARQKMSKSRRGKILTETHKANIRRGCVGINRGLKSEETKRKISLTKKGCIGPNKGKKLSNEWLKNLSLAHGGDGAVGKRYQKQLMYNKRRRMRKSQIIGSHTLKEWEDLKFFYQFMCLCCKKFESEITLSEDHIIPITKGGSDYIDNIQPLCRSCNSRKHTNIISYLPSSFNNLIYTEKGVMN